MAGEKNKNIQPGSEKQHSYIKKECIANRIPKLLLLLSKHSEELRLKMEW